MKSVKKASVNSTIIMSRDFLQSIEMQNLTLQTVDGILSHNGEIHKKSIEIKKT